MYEIYKNRSNRHNDGHLRNLVKFGSVIGTLYGVINYISKVNRHDITKILLKVALNTITLYPKSEMMDMVLVFSIFKKAKKNIPFFKYIEAILKEVCFYDVMHHAWMMIVYTQQLI